MKAALSWYLQGLQVIISNHYRAHWCTAQSAVVLQAQLLKTPRHLTADCKACPSSWGGHGASHDVSHASACCCKCFVLRKYRSCTRSCTGSESISNCVVIQSPHHKMGKNMGEMVERYQVHHATGAAKHKASKGYSY